MKISPHTSDGPAVKALLRKWVAPLTQEKGLNWVEEKASAIEKRAEDWVFFTSFSAVPRYTGKADLSLSAEDLAEAHTARAHWNPAGWSVDQAARSLMLLSLPTDPQEIYTGRLERVFNAADVGESVALYQTLPLYPNPEAFVERASEGLRTNMRPVFEAVALHNPFPAEYFEENAWNQMVLKCCFVGSSLHEVFGIDERANPTLARMLVDYAHERWAASREVTPDLWRPVGPFVGDGFLEDLERVLNDPNPIQYKSAALALSMSSDDGAADLLATKPELKSRIDSGTLGWNEE